ncbi:hypothetical protein TNCV_4135081 [Trichonephila clavipes]|nr:hypothetical protein TNCV_4135081 [Trichonephila clavipes]
MKIMIEYWVANIETVRSTDLRRLNFIILEELLLVILGTSEEIQEVHSSLCLGNTRLPSRALQNQCDEIGNVIEDSIDLTRQINLEVDIVAVEELMDSHNQDLTFDELTEMHEQE